MGETNTDELTRVREQAIRRQAALRMAVQAEQRAQIPGAFQRRFGSGTEPPGAGLPLSGPETTRQRIDRLAEPAPSAESTLPAGATPERIQEAARAALAAGDTAAARRLSLMAVEAEEREREQQPAQPALGAVPSFAAPMALLPASIAEAAAETPILRLYGQWLVVSARFTEAIDEEADALYQQISALEDLIEAEPVTSLEDLAAKAIATTSRGDFALPSAVIAECLALLAGGEAL